MAYEFLEGTVKWAMLDTPDKEYGHYKMNLYLDEKNLAKFESFGTNLTIRKDDEGTYVIFKRHPDRLLDGMAPKVKKLKITGWDGDKPITEDLEGLIGNGSTAIVKLDIYDLKKIKGRGHRLEAVAVKDLVEYSGTREEDLPF